VKVDAGKKLQGLREAAQSEGECQQKLEGLREAECAELLRAHDIPGREEALESSDVIVVRIILTNTGGEEGARSRGVRTRGRRRVG
jgi:hypothetical protein